MTEAEWLACDDPERMLRPIRRRASLRKLRMLACACCRRVWHLLPDDRSKAGVEFAEALADGTAERRELSAIRDAAYDAFYNIDQHFSGSDQAYAADAAYYAVIACYPDIGAADICPIINAAAQAMNALKADAGRDKRIADLVRDIHGYLFAGVSPLLLKPEPSIQGMVRAAYDERVVPSGELEPARLSILADALEEAGCSDAILSHLRSPGPHVRGCWALDLLLGKQ